MLIACQFAAFSTSMAPIGKPDSIIYQLNDLGKVRKSIYAYSNNKLSSITVYEASSLVSPWSPYKKSIFSEADGVQTTIDQSYVSASSSFVNAQRFDVKFDSYGNRVLEVYYIWDDTAAMWKGFRTKTERSYIDTGLLSAYTYSAWDTNTNSWLPFSQGSVKYTAFRKPEEIVYLSADANGVMNPSSKVVTSYLPDFSAEYETTYAYTSGSYIPTFRNHYEYSTNTPQLTETVEYYNATNQQWIAAQKTEKSYNGSGDIQRFLVSDRDTVSQLWKERFRHDVSVLSNTTDSLNVLQTDAPDATVRLIKRFKQINDANGLSVNTNTTEQNGSVILSTTTNVASNAGSITQLTNKDELENIVLNWSYDATNNALTCANLSYNDATGQQVQSRSFTIYFTNFQDAVPQVADSRLFFGPNPVKESLNITNTTDATLRYKVMTLEGKALYSGASNDKITTLSLSNLTPGAYLIQLSTANNKVKTSVFIKK